VKIPHVGGSLPPRERLLPFVPFYSPATERGFIAALTGQKVLLARHHWRDGKTVPCYGENCWCGKEGVPPKVKGYISCLLEGNLAAGILELTHGAVEQLLALVADPSKLRGQSVTLRRRNKNKCSAVEVQLCSWKPRCQLPAEIEPLPYVLKRWGCRVDLSFLQAIAQSPLADRPISEGGQE